jgi:Bifunctional DNA primase/polymerase, N-terminal
VVSAHLDAALAAVARGWPVFPCRPATKEPATEHGFEDATVDTDQIEKWWQWAPKRNPAVSTGAAGLVVVDCDPRENKQLPGRWRDEIGITDGLDCLAVLAERHDGRDELAVLLAVTRVVRTPRGGWHLYFRQPDEPIGCSASKIAPLIDIRGLGGYVLIEPGATDDGTYRLVTDLPPAPLPAFLRAAITAAASLPAPPSGPLRQRGQWTSRPHLRLVPRPGYGSAALRDEAVKVAAAATGERNHTLNVAVFRLGQLVNAGHLDENAVRDELTTAALTAGLGGRETERTIASGLNGGSEKPRRR